MLHNERKLPAPTVFELLSYKLYKKGGAFQKSTNYFCLIYIKGNGQFSIHAMFHNEHYRFNFRFYDELNFEWGF